VSPQTLAAIRAGVINVHSDTAYAIQELLDAYDAALAELRLANDSCDAYAAEVAELRAEIAAYQGRPEGALPGWQPWMHSEAWRHSAMGSLLEVRRGYADVGIPSGRWVWVLRYEKSGEAAGSELTPRAAMRAAEAAARARGLLLLALAIADSERPADLRDLRTARDVLERRAALMRRRA
jgi:hypothetical protein